MQAFSLDQTTGIPVKLQLKAHIKYQILAGILRPGDQLPPLRDLAAGLNINLNTVVRATKELEEDGFLYSHQGRGVFVADEFPGQGHGASLRSLMAGVLGPTREWGFAPAEIAQALLAHGQLARPPQAAPYRILLVGGARSQLRRFQRELEATLPVQVEPVLVEEAAQRARTSSYTAVAATLFHATEVGRHLPQATVVTLAGPPAKESFGALYALPDGSPVVILSRDWLHAARVRHSLELIGLDRLALQTVVGQTPSALAPALAGAGFVLVTPDAREIAREALGGRPGITVLTEPVEVSAEALTELRRALGAPAPEPRIHVRSAWV